jgi:hypothetical protein
MSCNNPKPGINNIAEVKDTSVPWLNSDTLVCSKIIKKDGFWGNKASSPSGFVVYSRPDSKGLYIQNLTDSLPRRVPNTQNDNPKFIFTSFDGNWIFYLDGYTRKVIYITPLGRNKGVAPTEFAEANYPNVAGIYRESPHGCEFIYTANEKTVRAVKFLKNDSQLTFVNDRVLLDLKNAPNSLYISGEPIPVYRDQLVTKIFGTRNGSLFGITAHVTIPQNGTGIATYADFYSWKGTPSTGSCGYAISADGSMIVSNAGGDYVQELEQCLPLYHKGFYVLPFFRGSDSVQYETIMLTHGISANWCPVEYRNGIPPMKNDFYRWDFGNSNDYLVGRVSGVESPRHCLWLIEWQTNTWTSLTPQSSQMLADFVSLHIGSYIDYNQFAPDTLTDTLTTPVIDKYNPCLEVLSPNGGEIFRVGDTCRVRVRALRDADAVLMIRIGDQLSRLPGVDGSINPHEDTLFTFIVPDSLYYCSGIDCFSFSTISSKCRILIQDYSGNANYFDYSDAFFIIKSKVN